jgi:hypothetical protein
MKKGTYAIYLSGICLSGSGKIFSSLKTEDMNSTINSTLFQEKKMRCHETATFLSFMCTAKM